VTSLRWAGGQQEHLVDVIASRGEVAGEARAVDGASIESDFAALEDRERPPLSASAAAGLAAVPSSASGDGPGSDRLLGALVHRLLQRDPIGADAPDEELRRTARMLLDAMPITDVADEAVVIDAAVRRVRALSDRPDLQELFRSGRAFHEFPFTMAWQDRTVRGTMDCLIATADGRIVVLEFKTGSPKPEHEAQLAIYRAAAERLFPGASVEARLVYTSEIDRMRGSAPQWAGSGASYSADPA
jgi:ATP-dependent helicase/nuclease subunit A